MNKTYRTVWCESTGTYVAVAENVKSRGKRGSSVRMLARATLALAAIGAIGAANAEVTVGEGAGQETWDGKTITFSAADGSIVFSQGGTISGLTPTALSAGSTDAATVGQVFTADQKATAAQTAVTTLDASAVKFNAGNIDAKDGKITNLANGSVAANSKEAVTGGQLHTVKQSAEATQTALTTLTGTVTTLNTNTVKFVDGAIDATNKKITKLADGTLAADGKEAVTSGQLFTTNQDIKTINDRLTNLGLVGKDEDYTGAKYFRVTSTKADAVASGVDAVAIGAEASAEAVSSMVIGQGAKALVTAENAVVVGNAAQAGGKRAVVIGDAASVESEFVEDAIAIGTGATADGISSSKGTAIGAGATVSAANATALGADAKASATSAAAVGAGAAASGASSVALGSAKAEGSNTLAFGTGAQANTANSIAMGTGAGVGTVGIIAGDRTSHIAIGTDSGRNVVGNQTIALGFNAGSDVDGDQNIAIGSLAGNNIVGDRNVAIGFEANKAGGTITQATAIGAETVADFQSAALGYQASAIGGGSIAIGYLAKATSGQGVALGSDTIASGGNVALGANSKAEEPVSAYKSSYLTNNVFSSGNVVSVGNAATQRRIVNVADGAEDHDAVNVAQLRSSQQTVANVLGGDLKILPNGQFSKITLRDSGNNELQFDTMAEALGAVTSGSVSILPAEAARYKTSGTLSVKRAELEDEAVNLEQLNTAIDNNASRYYSVNSAQSSNRDNAGATGTDAVAIGPASNANGANSLAVGNTSKASSDQATAFGYKTVAGGANSTAIGNESIAYGNGGVAIGDDARSQGLNSIAIGTRSGVDPKTPPLNVDNSIAIGTDAESTAQNGIAIGQDAVASDVRGVAQGYKAVSSAADATAIGSNSEASGVNAMAMGTESAASGRNAAASGTRSVASGTSAIASGTDAKGYAASGIAMGQGAQAGKAKPLPGEEADNVNALAIGTNALADGKNSTAMGRLANATAEQALAVGDGSTVSGLQGSAFGASNNVSAERGLALGTRNEIAGTSSSATGDRNDVSGNNSQVVGNSNNVQASNAGVMGNSNTLGPQAGNSRIIGNNNNVDVADAFVLGNRSRVAIGGGVAIGSGSTSLTGAERAGYVPNTNGGAANNAISDTISTTGAVAVGGDGVLRQITGLAAGTANSDAVNVAQLKATGWNVKVNGDTSTPVSTGEGGTLDIGLAAGENNLTVTRGVENGHAVIDYALKKDLNLGSDGSLTAGVTSLNNAGVRVGPNVALSATGLSTGAGNPSVTTTGISAGNKLITGVKAGESTTDAVNFGQLTDLANKPLSFTADTGNKLDRKLGESVAITGSNSNLSTQTTTTGVQVSLSNTLNLDSAGSVKTGNTLLNNAGLTITGGPSVVAGGINAGGKTITQVANGVNGTDAVNLSQLNNVKDIANSGWNLTAEGGNLSKVAPSETVDLSSTDGNIVISKGVNDENVKFALSNTLDLGEAGSLSLGDTVLTHAGVSVGRNVVLGNTGLSIIGGPSVTTGGINAGNRAITNVADGTEDDHAVNLSQLNKFKADQAATGWNLTTQGIDGAAARSEAFTVKPDGTVDLSSGNTNLAITKTVGAETGEVLFTMSDDLDLTADGSVTIGDTVMNNAGITITPTGGGPIISLGNTGLTIADGPSVTTAGISGGDKKITNVLAGEDPTDAVNVAQLTDLANKPLTFTANKGDPLATKLGESVAIIGADQNITTEITDDGLTIALSKNLDLGATGSINIGDASLASGGLTIVGGPSVLKTGINAGNQKITNLLAGVDVDDAVNVGQLNDVRDVANKGWKVSVNGNVAGDQSQVKPDDVVDFANVDGNVLVSKGADGHSIKVDLNEDLVVSSVTTGDTIMNNDGVKVGDFITLNNTGLLIAGGPSVTRTGINAGGLKITGVAAGEDDTDAVNVSQLKEVKNSVGDLDDRAVKYDGSTGDPKGNITLAGDVSTDGGTTGGTKITNLAKGEISATSTDAINGSQLHEQGEQIAGALGGTSKYENGKLVTELNVGGDTYNNVNDALNGVNTKVDDVSKVANAGWQIGTNGDAASKVAPGSKVEFVDGDNVKITRETSASGDNTVKVSMAQDIKVNSVTAKEVKADTVKTKQVVIENGPKIDQNGIDMNNKRISNLAAGINAGDAVNVRQLESATAGLQSQVNQVRGDLNKLDNKLSAGVASAMATAGLPQAYLPGKSMMSIAGGTYNGESGYAIGVSTISDNGSWVVKLSGNGNSRGDYGGAVGVGYQW